MERVLIIEDEDAIAELERDYLTISGYEVETESDGTAGMERALAEDFDMVLVDVMLPGTDGFSIVRAIREKKNTPVILVSARGDDIDKIRGLGLGADDYMTKPFSPGELVARVKAHIERYRRLSGPAPSSDIITVRDLKIDCSTHEVTVRDKTVSLTAKEYDILLYLIKNPGRPISKEELFEKIWEVDAIGDIKTVVVYINRIREKLEKDPSRPEFIETVWGMGYRFKM